jgi:hypothetical protein
MTITSTVEVGLSDLVWDLFEKQIYDYILADAVNPKWRQFVYDNIEDVLYIAIVESTRRPITSYIRLLKL